LAFHFTVRMIGDDAASEPPSTPPNSSVPAMKQASLDVWAAHRAALAPSVPSASTIDALATLRDAFGSDSKVAAFFEHHGVSGLWYQALCAQIATNLTTRDAAFIEQLKPAHMGAVALHSLQNRAIKQITEHFDSEQIAMLFFKAAGVREELYDSLGLRPCTDLDILVAPADRFRAMTALQSLGAVCIDSQDSSAHESTWKLGLVDIDLHWDILGAGRLPAEVTTQMLERRVKTVLGWRPDNVDCLFVALVHPAFAKHVCSRHMGLNRVNDTLRMLDRFQIDARVLESRLRAAGVLRAARISAYWLSLLSEEMIKNNKINYLLDEPKVSHELWLRFCVDRNLPDRWVQNHRITLNLMFTGLLHDSLGHAWRALRGATARVGKKQNSARPS
jgi:hypothetical protein